MRACGGVVAFFASFSLGSGPHCQTRQEAPDCSFPYVWWARLTALDSFLTIPQFLRHCQLEFFSLTETRYERSSYSRIREGRAETTEECVGWSPCLVLVQDQRRTPNPAKLVVCGANYELSPSITLSTLVYTRLFLVYIPGSPSGTRTLGISPSMQITCTLWGRAGTQGLRGPGHPSQNILGARRPTQEKPINPQYLQLGICTAGVDIVTTTTTEGGGGATKRV